jgi:Na+/H+-dicarboxylate symporter
MSPTARVLTALLGGAALGIAFASAQPALAREVAGVAQPIGDLWLNALQMTVVPLVVALVVLGVASTSDAAVSGRTARRAIGVFLVLLCAGATFAAVFAPFQLSLLPRDPELIASLRAAIGTPPAADGATASFAQRFATIIPSNVVAAAAQAAMLPLVVCALLFGFALTRVEARRRTQAIDLIQTLADVTVTVVRWVLWAAPLGVFALAFSVCVKAGLSVLSALGWYIVAQCSLYLLVTLGLYLVAVFAGGQRLRQFVAGILPAQAIAISTQSSLATLPAMVEIARDRLGCSPAVTSLVLPMAVSLFRMTSPVDLRRRTVGEPTGHRFRARGGDQSGLGGSSRPGEPHGDEHARVAVDGIARGATRPDAGRRDHSGRVRHVGQRHRRSRSDHRRGA